MPYLNQLKYKYNQQTENLNANNLDCLYFYKIIEFRILFKGKCKEFCACSAETLQIAAGVPSIKKAESSLRAGTCINIMTDETPFNYLMMFYMFISFSEIIYSVAL